MTIPFEHAQPWSRSVIGSEPDTSVEMMAHIALTSLCEDRLTVTAAQLIALLLIQNQENLYSSSALRPCLTTRTLTSYQLFDFTREEVKVNTHGIIHLEHTIEVQDAKLEERAKTSANLEKRLLQLQGLAPPAPVDHEEISAMSGINEN
jgi:hypothetical protein